MKKASVLFLALAALAVTACSSSDEAEEEAAEKVVYTVDSGASTLMWHGEENEQHFHDGVITISEGSMTMEGEKVISGEFKIDPSSIKPQTEGYPAEKMDYLKSDLLDTAFLFTSEYPTIDVKTGAYENGKLDTKITVRGVEISSMIPVKIETKDGIATVKGDFVVDFSPVGMPYLETVNEETGKPGAKSGIQFKMDLKLKK